LITKFDIYIKENLDETRVRVMAWLYLLFVYDHPGSDGMEEKSWLKDNRMGVTFEMAVHKLKKDGLVRFVNNKWKITNKGKKELVKFFNPPKTRDEWMNYDSSWLRKYDNDDIWTGYRISRIPTDLFERLFDQESKSKMNYTLTDEEYQKIREWWVKYQRGIVGWWTQLNKYLGLKNELIPDVDELTLYRGLNFNLGFQNVGLLPKNTIKTSRGIVSVTDLKVGDSIICSKPSWTIDKKIAKMFASGRKGWGDTRIMGNEEIGIVLKHTFPYTDLFLDTNWVQNNENLEGEVVLPQEMEVIVKPKNRNVEIIEVFNHKDFLHLST
jgi:hypothetical protein